VSIVNPQHMGGVGLLVGWVGCGVRQAHGEGCCIGTEWCDDEALGYISGESVCLEPCEAEH
jgi:hypothetical protein